MEPRTDRDWVENGVGSNREQPTAKTEPPFVFNTTWLCFTATPDLSAGPGTYGLDEETGRVRKLEDTDEPR